MCRPAILTLATLLAAAPAVVAAQTMTIEEYAPRNTLVVPAHPVTRAKFPFIDVHSHMRGDLSAGRVAQMVAEMDALNMVALVDLSGGTNGRVADKIALLKKRYPDRFLVFTNIDFNGIDEPGWTERAVAQLETDVKVHGAQGVKIFKDLGLTVRDKKGSRVATDDPRIDPVWRAAGELGVPVLIHTGEPAEFFQPIDARNERWLELKLHPDRARPASAYPTWDIVMSEQWNVFRKHPGTTFINAHLGWLGNDLARLGRLLDENPNVYTEVAAVIYELGRQPRMAKAFLDRYQDRVLMGKDTYNPSEYHLYFRVLETDDEYFDYYRRYHAFWQMYGIGLSDEVLKKIYYRNALKIIPGLDATRFPI